MQNPELSLLNKFIELYEELIAHDGYGDMQLSIRKSQGKKKQVSLLCGREYQFEVVCSPRRQYRYKVIDSRANSFYAYGDKERRKNDGRRGKVNRRQQNGVPRNFRLEHRIISDRRNKPGGRRKDH